MSSNIFVEWQVVVQTPKSRIFGSFECHLCDGILLQESVRIYITDPAVTPIHAIQDNVVGWVVGRPNGPAQGVWGTRRDPKQHSFTPRQPYNTRF